MTPFEAGVIDRAIQHGMTEKQALDLGSWLGQKATRYQAEADYPWRTAALGATVDPVISGMLPFGLGGISHVGRMAVMPEGKEREGTLKRVMERADQPFGETFKHLLRQKSKVTVPVGAGAGGVAGTLLGRAMAEGGTPKVMALKMLLGAALGTAGGATAGAVGSGAEAGLSGAVSHHLIKRMDPAQRAKVMKNLQERGVVTGLPFGDVGTAL